MLDIMDLDRLKKISIDLDTIIDALKNSETSESRLVKLVLEKMLEDLDIVIDHEGGFVK